MNKKTWIVIAAVLVVLIAALVIFPINRGTKTEPAAQTDPVTAQTESVKEETPTTPPAKATEEPSPTPEAEEYTSAQILEDEGDLIIEIPEGEESDGF